MISRGHPHHVLATARALCTGSCSRTAPPRTGRHGCRRRHYSPPATALGETTPSSSRHCSSDDAGSSHSHSQYQYTPAPKRQTAPGLRGAAQPRTGISSSRPAHPGSTSLPSPSAAAHVPLIPHGPQHARHAHARHAAPSRSDVHDRMPDGSPGSSASQPAQVPGPSSWEAISENKRASRDARIPPSWKLHTGLLPLNVMSVPETCGILSAEDVEITNTPAPRLVELMLAGTYTSEVVTASFCKRAAIAQQLTNCLTEIFFAQALVDARALDAEYQRTGVPAGKLHGLPVSLKDNCNVPGVDSSNGFISYCNTPMGEEDTADLARVMREAGAILYCKTNIPTGMMMGETYNNVWGYTSNPYNTDYTPGGSSGGEGALIALGGSPLGVGSDIGGSIRMPAALCGLYGLKPSAGRFPVLGIRPALPGQEAIRATVGPIAPDLDSIELWSRVILESSPWERDPMVFNMPWKEDVKVPEKLCFGMIMDDGIVRPTPAITRVLNETRAALEAQGHKVVDWTPPDVRAGVAIHKRLLLADGGVRIGSALKNGSKPEPWPLQLRTFEKVYKRLKAGTAPPTVSGLWEMQAERQRYLRRMLDAWAATRAVSDTGRPFDGVISPVCAFPSTPRYTFRHAGYAGIWNLADCTSVAFPAGTARKTDVVDVEASVLRNEDEKCIWAKYDPDRLDGMPVGLQLVTPRHTEELALKLTRVVIDAIKA